MPLPPARQYLVGELLVLADVTGYDTGDAVGGDKRAEADVVDAAVVGHHVESRSALFVEGGDENGGDAA